MEDIPELNILIENPAVIVARLNYSDMLMITFEPSECIEFNNVHFYKSDDDKNGLIKFCLFKQKPNDSVKKEDLDGIISLSEKEFKNLNWIRHQITFKDGLFILTIPYIRNEVDKLNNFEK